MSGHPGAVFATAPVRVADVGGWTDTWFGAPGRVCHVAVEPGVTASARWLERGDAAGAPTVTIVAPDIGLTQSLIADRDLGWHQPQGAGGEAAADPLLAHAVGAVLAPDDRDAPGVAGRSIRLEVRAAVEPGASLGTSAAIVVAALAALDVLVAGGRRTPAELAVLAHQVETERAGRQAGVQDQWAAALGGVGDLNINPYPTVRHRRVDLASGVAGALSSRLITVCFGRHDSSAVHRQVIDAMVSCSGVEHHHARQALRTLTLAAGAAADALGAGDLTRWGRVLTEATAAQAALADGLVGPAHRAAIDVAEEIGAIGWKVNGAGGDGGSLTVLLEASSDVRVFADRLRRLDPTWSFPALRPSADGVRVHPSVAPT